MSFTGAPVTRTLVLGLVGSSIAASLLDIKHYFYISIGTHIIKYHQLWRPLVYQLCYTNSSEVLFGAMALYHLRTIEQRWGSRKYASFIFVTTLFTSILPPLILMVFLRPMSFGVLDFLPAGPTPIMFAILAQYHAMIPHMYRYKVALSTGPPASNDTLGLTFSDKTTKYFMAAQLAMFQFPGSLLGALVGWLVGYAWRNEALPGALTSWRVPGWVVGMREQKTNPEFENMRRRLESEGASTTGAQPNQAEGNRRRTMGEQLIDEVRGAF